MHAPSIRHIGLQFGHIKHFNEGLAEFSRQLATHYAKDATQLKAEKNWHFHYILPKQWHGMLGHDVTYHDLTENMRWHHRFPVDLDIWHGLHQHMRYVPPANCHHSIITVHDLNHVYAKRGLSLWWQNLRLTKQLRRAHQLVAISQFVANDIQSHLPWAPPTTVIHNGVADFTSIPHEPIADLIGRPFLLHLSRMSQSKNVGALLQMAAIWPDQLLVLAGPTSPDSLAHEAYARKHGLTNVCLLSDITESQKAWLYANCRAFLFPSTHEGFGLPPIEAMHFGKPVIASNLTSLPEICGQSAAYWEHFEPTYMRKIVEHQISVIKTDSTKSTQVQAHARRYTWSLAGQRYMELYSKNLSTC